MGEAALKINIHQLCIHSVLFFYGDAASDAFSIAIVRDIADHWNEAKGKVIIKNVACNVVFDIEGIWARSLTPEMIFENANPRNNYFRLEEFAQGNISFVDGVGSNTGYFKVDNLLNNSTTAAHEYGHTIGLAHPEILDIRGKGVPGIMYPRGTIVDPEYQYSPVAAPLAPGGTINPFSRKVQQEDIDNLQLSRLSYNRNGIAVIGNFTSIWHQQHQL
ncbi:peptidase M10 [Ferruginibacter sp.]|uniref:peptidase M10 n=1 Tax=Ferruginibacter sp. TaxID=1940288 RepID=UPI0026590C6E|nr:peptidase M10 [Ferruginibacter sp.]